MLHVAVNAISLSDTFFKKLPRTHSAVAFSKTKPAALGFDLDVKAKISGMKPPDRIPQAVRPVGFFFCAFLSESTEKKRIKEYNRSIKIPLRLMHRRVFLAGA